MFWITHICADKLPIRGDRKLSYFTTMETKGEYFCGTDNNPFTQKQIDTFVKNKQLVPLQKKVPLPGNKTLWVDPTGIIFLGDRHDSSKTNREEIGVYSTVLGKIF